ncbi:unnamed protein product [Nippostrongylus brasiliensis]|uniref:Ig-like domain-containing protein n=1 Tax=Nippostrongylus brasiliensis TaxID=27835 RepID=A0A0N4YSA9_NIPBR|nr:unnamed protein product [Nippostrongylus brasiliensis]
MKLRAGWRIGIGWRTYMKSSGKAVNPKVIDRIEVTRTRHVSPAYTFSLGCYVYTVKVYFPAMTYVTASEELCFGEVHCFSSCSGGTSFPSTGNQAVAMQTLAFILDIRQRIALLLLFFWTIHLGKTADDDDEEEEDPLTVVTNGTLRVDCEDATLDSTPLTNVSWKFTDVRLPQ